NDLRGLRARNVAWLRAHWPSARGAELEHFIALLFRRGHATLDGQRATSDGVVREGHTRPGAQLAEVLHTESCNRSCGYCLAGAKPGMPNMTPEVGRRTIDLAFAAHEATSLTFEFAGGEPFLRFDLLRELSAYALCHPERKGRDVHLCVQTNATLLD